MNGRTKSKFAKDGVMECFSAVLSNATTESRRKVVSMSSGVSENTVGRICREEQHDTELSTFYDIVQSLSLDCQVTLAQVVFPNINHHYGTDVETDLNGDGTTDHHDANIASNKALHTKSVMQSIVSEAMEDGDIDAFELVAILRAHGHHRRASDLEAAIPIKIASEQPVRHKIGG